MEQKRLNKAISETGFSSRRGADKLIEAGRVTVNGNPIVLGEKVMASDSIEVDGKPIRKRVEPIYLLFNKPVGITCTTELDVEGNIISFINYPKRIFPIGRLDKPSQGLIFLTNDGDIVNKILRSKNHHEKEYIVKVDRPVDDQFIEEMSSGIPILDKVTKPCRVEKLSTYSFKIVLTEGMNRQIRRMCNYLDFGVTALKRERIMNVELGNLKVGKYRHFTQEEKKELFELLEYSTKTN
ncbi:MAG: pseudouridine synthase [Flavobacteriales bacterium]